ncbi:MAG: nickel-dependent lactate racemase [Promethearchaeota archaeon]
MKIKLAYGKKGLDVDLPASLNIEVVWPMTMKALDNPGIHVERALNSPINSPRLEEIIESKIKNDVVGDINELIACLVVSDHTRPIPTYQILPPILDRLHTCGLSKDNIKILIATGLHRRSSSDELEEMLGDEIVRDYTIICHDATDKEVLDYIGTSSSGSGIWINRNFISAHLRILTGYVDPHFFAGFAGGRKSVVPGIAGSETILANHSARNINDENARFLKLEKNPIHEDALEIARMVGVDFIVNVCLNDRHEITRVSAGDLESAHMDLVSFMANHVVKSFEDYFDIVVVNNGGYPLDLNLYQAVKSMAIGELIVRDGGVIISVNELSDGFGPMRFKEILEAESDPGQLIDKLITGELVTESQWEVQILARVLQRSDIFVVSSLGKNAFKDVKIGLKWAPDVLSAIKIARGCEDLGVTGGPAGNSSRGILVKKGLRRSGMHQSSIIFGALKKPSSFSGAFERATS